jgi:hypothetical protein
VTLGCLRVAKHLGGLGRLALGAGSPLVCGGAIRAFGSARPASTVGGRTGPWSPPNNQS